MKERRVRVLETSVFSVLGYKPQAFPSSLIEEFGGLKTLISERGVSSYNWCFQQLQLGAT